MFPKNLKPIPGNLPQPTHIKIKPQCFTCKHFQICNLRDDYLKTCYLIENVLGNPAQSFEIAMQPPSPFPNYKGEILNNQLDDTTLVFPNTIKSISGQDGEFLEAKYEDENTIHFLYRFKKCYCVMFDATYSTDKWVISKGIESIYKAIYEIQTDDIEIIEVGLALWRDKYLSEKQPNCECCKKEPDVINTTFFSSEVRCNFYDWNKKQYNESIEDLIRIYPKGVPLGHHGFLYHLATFHCEPDQVPYYQDCGPNPPYSPLPYPAPPKKRKKYITRDQIRHED
jgi:hypothetical protein